MIHYIEHNNKRYYSASDIALALAENIPLTDFERLKFRGKCQKYIVESLSLAMKRNFIIDFNEPIILGFGDYYLHWTQWAHCFDLLPVKHRSRPYVKLLNRLINYPEGWRQDYEKQFVALEITVFRHSLTNTL